MLENIKTKKQLSESHKLAIAKGHMGKSSGAKGKHWKQKTTRSIELREKVSKNRLGKSWGKHSEKTKSTLRLKNIGSKHPNWQGGISFINEKYRKSADYRLWRKACLDRDNFTCQKTRISGGELHVHHINNFKDFPELKTEISNGIVLSKKAHTDFHKIYGKKNNTREQLEEFLAT